MVHSPSVPHNAAHFLDGDKRDWEFFPAEFICGLARGLPHPHPPTLSRLGIFPAGFSAPQLAKVSVNFDQKYTDNSCSYTVPKAMARRPRPTAAQ